MVTAGFSALHSAFVAANLTTSETAILVVLIPSLFGLLNLLLSYRMRRQLHPNGGSTVRDAIDRILKRLEAIEEYITTPKEQQ